jgi:hypothetical protein
VKGALLVGLLAVIVAAIRVLARGDECVWLPALSQRAAQTVFRGGIIGVGLVAWFVSQSLIASRQLRDGMIGDAVHDWTAPLHRWLVATPRAADAVLVVSSGLIDALGIFLLGWSLIGPSLRPGIALLILFAFRQIAQLTCALPAPPGMIWRRPGVPSLLVTYDVANDFFFSGHTSIAVLGAIELATIAPAPLAVAGIAIAVFEAATVLVLRAHYTMDVLTGAVAAFCAAGLASLICVGF